MSQLASIDRLVGYGILVFDVSKQLYEEAETDVLPCTRRKLNRCAEVYDSIKTQSCQIPRRCCYKGSFRESYLVGEYVFNKFLKGVVVILRASMLRHGRMYRWRNGVSALAGAWM